MDNHYKPLVEALIFAAPEPLDAEAISRILEGVAPEDVTRFVAEINAEYELGGRPFFILDGAGGWRFASRPEYAAWVKRVAGTGRLRLSRAALETVSLIAFRQPITRSEIEAIRGVDVGGVLKMLLERRLITVCGRAPGPGRSLQYATTDDFLRYFGLKSLDELPRPEELTDKPDREIPALTELDYQQEEQPSTGEP